MKETIHIKANGQVLKWAREQLVLNLSKASSNIGITERRLEKIENGVEQPSLDELKAMSKTYKRTIATLLLQIPPVEKPLPVDRRTVESKELDIFHEKTIIAVRKARALLEAFIELKAENGFLIKPFHYQATLQDSAEIIAANFRQDWKLSEVRELSNSNYALDAYIEKVESIGVAIFQLSLTQDNLRGFSLVDESTPIIVIKRGEQPTAKIFTLFHELAHIILKEGGLCDINFDQNVQLIEKWCNAFAANILMPSEELLNMPVVKNQLMNGQKNWTKKDLVELANHFHVGPLAILRRLLDHDLTTISFYKEKHLIWNRPSFARSKNHEGRDIAKETIKEKGRTYITLAFKAFDQNRIDLKDLSDFLGVKLSYIPKTRQLLNSL